MITLKYLRTIPASVDSPPYVRLFLFVVIGLILGCDPPRQQEDPIMQNQETRSNSSLEGLWVSCPERTEWGPMFSQIRIWREMTFDMRVLGRDPAREIWTGVSVMKGRVDLEKSELVPSEEYGMGDDRWEITWSGDEMIVRHVFDEGMEETRLRRLE